MIAVDSEIVIYSSCELTCGAVQVKDALHINCFWISYEFSSIQGILDATDFGLIKNITTLVNPVNKLVPV